MTNNKERARIAKKKRKRNIGNIYIYISLINLIDTRCLEKKARHRAKLTFCATGLFGLLGFAAGLGDENACAAAATRPAPRPADGVLALTLWFPLPAALLFRGPAEEVWPMSEGNDATAKGAAAAAA
jgi:hypothetical protein